MLDWVLCGLALVAGAAGFYLGYRRGYASAVDDINKELYQQHLATWQRHQDEVRRGQASNDFGDGGGGR